ncbi:hypothetical protein [Flavobacterium sp. GT3R68]|uniref:hypothetical protein n=1 Tax=Flavobacterium sp. GT3R68 TaxID=2594437 RepID=UPI000F87FB72|nr:hypothetical protein [Flavobacterium sp. GT3R68]RTY93875.1 hypothetical protein EKL32_13395 [Flavobacterium sp. GSN2]TRW93511.1 hypothetical protein FNW07_00990 [Flavobacterium sp. GT3R68]
MGYREFFPFGAKSIEIVFKCNGCGHEITSEELFLPKLNYLVDDANNQSNEYAYCSHCEKEFDISVNVAFSDSYVEISDVPSLDILDIIENSDNDDYYNEQIDSILSGSDYYDIFLVEMENLKSLNDVDLKSKELQNTLLRQIYSSVISCLEDYLSSTLINEVLNKEENFKNFVKTNPKIKERKFSLNDIYQELDKINDIVKKELVDVIYHDLPKVRNMYQDSLKIQFPEIADLMSIIKTRHDMVHRNGKDKEGNVIRITESTIDDIIEIVEEFAMDIESKVRHTGVLGKIPPIS